ncbi:MULTISPECIES: glycerol-3-phosphate 1-O-acyltransferase PlsY [Brochothrix]|uniref:Glycerol-3-phosphate acyltransferase n=1 Tax=Brochothrix thermosphacta TaxID=2756 RepID=A0A1D2L603_BROTH|nr:MULTISPECIES: glycerol-3-phosphate 1-O-acyltransferase PlsY [Brochothrix]ANZ94095.1 glycerol-3-phosphate acyltransferase [Brochothrix thermosphacta]ANZ97607.1 glycerol-3-phosphate acyltransferase [Brochothrix thermosphacta]ATF27053.1 glycerol-3-phosphate 1-O-acyltransferase PlsY [Brochothrix thermosphacta]ATH86411.1 glycerol-3-phosphate 1-O-acyltransferase PlsY [Brochothrix thermosphacta]EUJ34031.1 membrane protein YgiH [Brochothrix thermosphacta DSM 20171 = FSL F6-1036]
MLFIAQVIGLMLVAYLIGSFTAGLWIGKWFFKKDIREYGSHNLGATNSFRILGVKAGIVVMIIDVLKGTLATLLPVWLHVPINPLLIGVFAVIGHIYPAYAKLRGGKAVATSAGILLGYSPSVFLVLMAVFVIVLVISRYVSLSSMIAVVVGLIASIFLKDYVLIIVMAILTIFILYRHRANISRIKNGTESKIKFKSSKKTS